MKRYVKSSSEQQNYLYEKLKSLATDDYQNRDGDYPRSNVADTVAVSPAYISCEFKNTSENSAARWLESFLSRNGVKVNIKDIDTWQDGDYEDDWVIASWECKNEYHE